jgi:hypothetical protein
LLDRRHRRAETQVVAMSRSAAATSAGRQHAPQRPRRVSGPARAKDRAPRARIDASVLAAPGAAAYPRPQRLPARPPLRVVAGGAAIARGVAGVALDVSTSRLMDRLVRSRGWIVIVAFALIGIVAMQVSMLKLNAGIGRAVETVDTLERSNSSLRGEVSRLSSGDRIQRLAGARGFVMPAPADVTYLRARDLRSDGARAARSMQAPDRQIAGPAGAPVEVSATPAGGAGIAAPANPTALADPIASAAAPATLPTSAAPQTAAPAGTTAPGATAAPASAPPAQIAAPTAAAPQTTVSPAGGVAPPAAAPTVGGTG